MSSSTWFAAVRHPAPADFEQWLEAKAADGQILAGYSRISPLRMTFTESAPAQMRYVVERRENPAPIDYFRFREADGWEHVGNASDFHVWSRQYTGQRPDGFIGADLNREASRLGLILAIVAAVTLIAAVALGATSVAVSASAALWVPAIVLGVVGLAATTGAAAFAVSERTATVQSHSTNALVDA
ncbi:DUF2812 domain-containing protein [Gordonia sp. (in: high G+C Gram-positive bacteria)]|uniref:DUF2812 domain-containing protein n=1 Tax=Gordonia sp. (in: high G+C Gram-positive bacteria) TaxID=84139 RepID=UPI0016B944AE|nr:DUF2812 domain-containing protein [Gordonia sp. (in: high G+C Gram-positive bacteria)]NLG45698.1 DUF2812 domain-containing protein [Gordonia sp. (in: high G+C Gram-positive bacteria)]